MKSNFNFKRVFHFSLSKSKMITIGLVPIIFLSCSRQKEQVHLMDESLEMNSDFKTELQGLTTTIDVSYFGAKQNDNLDDTKAFQQAIDYISAKGGGVVTVNNAGKYIINPDVSIKMASNVALNMKGLDRVLQASSTSSGRYEIIEIFGKNNVGINSGTIIGDLVGHTGDTCLGQCEQGFGVCIKGSNKVTINSTQIKDCWGDGIIVSGLNGTKSMSIKILNIICDRNRRQGLTIGGGVDGLEVAGSVFKNTGQYKGTKPMAGIDIEPDTGLAQNILITNCDFFSNVGKGIEIFKNPETTAQISNVTVKGNRIYNHKTFAGWISGASKVIFGVNSIWNNVYVDEKGVSHNRNGVRVVSCSGCTINDPVIN